MKVQEIKETAAAKASKMSIQQLLSAKEANQNRFNGGGDLEDYLIASDVLNAELSKRKNELFGKALKMFPNSPAQLKVRAQLKMVMNAIN